MKTITVPEIAKDLGVGPAKVYAMLRDGQIPCLRNGNRYIIGRVAFQRWLEALGLNQLGAQGEAVLQ